MPSPNERLRLGIEPRVGVPVLVVRVAGNPHVLYLGPPFRVGDGFGMPGVGHVSIGDQLSVTVPAAEGFPVLDADIARLSPYMYAHINVHGHYTFTAPDLGGARRPLRDTDAE